ncbi:MAG TPA: hypothetical protein VFX24_03690 [Ktedonobacterales bacterium]|jgi:hypothetical protein|nr:hypothetical protein [Ktedonobacterales bacterium]
MADWQGQLADLLASLNVSLDPNESVPRAIDLRAESFSRMPVPTEEAPPAAISAEDVPVEGVEVSAVRSEIEFIVARVVELERAGVIDRVLRDDIIYVLQALTRPAPLAPRPTLSLRRRHDSDQEWDLASAAAVLRFCRLIQRQLPFPSDEHSE